MSPVVVAAEDVAEEPLQLIIPETPLMAGPLLQAAVAFLEAPVIGPSIGKSITQRTIPGLFKILREQAYPEQPRLSCIPDSAPAADDADNAVVVDSSEASERVAAAMQALASHPSTVPDPQAMTKPRPTVLDYHYSYLAGVVTPLIVAERAIHFLEAHNSTNHWLSAWSAQHIREAAAASTDRYAAGKPLSVLDGVPFAVKDNIDALPYETSYGTRFMGKLHPIKADAPCVAALKQLGAVLLGKAAMVEFGCLATGYNTHLGSTRNPHNRNKASGGSSSGSAAAVAAGLCPIAIGTDGGGSIRIPSSLCGVMGLKPTMGRLADDHAVRGCFSSMTVSGPIATSVTDLVLLYAAMANTDYTATPSDATISSGSSSSGGGKAQQQGAVAECGVAAAAAVAAPPMRPLELPQQLLPGRQLPGSGGLWRPLSGMRFGIYKDWYTACSPGVLAAVDAAVESLVKLGAAIVDIHIPELNQVQAAHATCFAAEYYYDAGQAGWRENWSLRKQLNLDSRMFYCNGRMFKAQDYAAALQIRARALAHFERAFQQCDIIITPATPSTAADFHPAVHTSGMYDVAQTFEGVRFTQAASLTGLPALVLPAGRVQQEDGMPVGIQLIGRHFAEATLLKAAAALEQCVQPVVPPLVISSTPLERRLTDDIGMGKDQMKLQTAQTAAVKGRSFLHRLKRQPSSRGSSSRAVPQVVCGDASPRGMATRAGRTSLAGLT